MAIKNWVLDGKSNTQFRNARLSAWWVLHVPSPELHFSFISL